MISLRSKLLKVTRKVSDNLRAFIMHSAAAVTADEAVKTIRSSFFFPSSSRQMVPYLHSRSAFVEIQLRFNKNKFINDS